MNSTKNSTTDINNDLKFIPLSLKEPFNSKDSSWVPFINMDVNATNMTNNFFIGLPNIQEAQGLTPLPNINAMPSLPYPSITPIQPLYDLNAENENINLNNKLNTFPENIKTSNNENNIIAEDELYPSEILKDELYSYNEGIYNPLNENTRINLPHLDLLRDFDLSLDEDITDPSRGCCMNSVDKIFNNIEEYNSDLLATLKSYKIPYPIATLIIKKIIKVTLNFSKKE